MTYNEEFTERVKKEQIHPKLCLTIKFWEWKITKTKVSLWKNFKLDSEFDDS